MVRLGEQEWLLRKGSVSRRWLDCVEDTRVPDRVVPLGMNESLATLADIKASAARFSLQYPIVSHVTGTASDLARPKT